jgi:branched-chain amino acid transport system ATP-binding protein
VAEPLLAVRDFRAGYGAVQIVNGVSFTVAPGELVAIMGPNGAGKSTLLRALFGLATVMGGVVHVAGRALVARTPREVLAAGLAFVPQGRSNFPLMTVVENLEMALFDAPRPRIREAMTEAYALFPLLAGRASELAGNLSGGEQQMLEMAMALVRRPRLLLLDEPTIGLAPATIGQVFAEIRRLHARGLTVVMVEQNTKKAMEIATRALVMRTGRVAYDGAAALSPDALGTLFMTGALPPGMDAPRAATT